MLPGHTECSVLCLQPSLRRCLSQHSHTGTFVCLQVSFLLLTYELFEDGGYVFNHLGISVFNELTDQTILHRHRDHQAADVPFQ